MVSCILGKNHVFRIESFMRLLHEKRGYSNDRRLACDEKAKIGNLQATRYQTDVLLLQYGLRDRNRQDKRNKYNMVSSCWSNAIKPSSISLKEC